jgi:hypothetical protein
VRMMEDGHPGGSYESVDAGIVQFTTKANT